MLLDVEMVIGIDDKIPAAKYANVFYRECFGDETPDWIAHQLGNQ